MKVLFRLLITLSVIGILGFLLWTGLIIIPLIILGVAAVYDIIWGKRSEGDPY